MFREGWSADRSKKERIPEFISIDFFCEISPNFIAELYSCKSVRGVL